MSGKRDRQRELENSAGTSTTGRWLRRLLVLTLLAAILAFFAPTFVAKTSLRQRIGKLVLPTYPGEISIGSASLGWFSPVRLYNVTALDAAGQPLLEADEVTSEFTLLALARDTSNLGLFHIARPRLHLVLRDDGSNLEDAIAPLLEPSDEPTKPWSIAVRVEQGTIEAHEASSERKWTANQVDAEMQLPADAAQPLQAKLSGAVDSPNDPDGKIEVELAWQPSANSVLGSGQCSLKSKLLPLEMTQPLLRRFVGDMRAGGLLTADGKYAWEQDGTRHSLTVDQLTASSLVLHAPQWLGEDQLSFQQVTGHGKLALADGRLQLENVTLNSDVAKLAGSGTLRVGDFTADTLLAVLENNDYRITGDVDLARLAVMLPRTLRIREGTRITSGKASATLFSRVENGQRRWIGSLETANLTAEDSGREITWQPIVVTFSAAQTADGPIIEQMACNASFLTLAGHGTLDEGEITASGNLTQLADELARFVDMSAWKLAGSLQAGVAWRRGGDGRLSADGDVVVENFQMDVPGGRPWREQRLTVAVDAAGLVDAGGIRQLDSASLTVQSGTDRLTARLVEPLTDVTFSSRLPLACDVNGRLATWLPRVQTWVPLSGWELDGQMALNTTAAVTGQRVEVSAADLRVNDLLVRSAGLLVKEPEVHVTTRGAVDLNVAKLALGETVLTSSTISLRTNKVSVQAAEAGWLITGEAALRTDLARLMACTYDPAQPPAYHVFGEMTGVVNLAHAGNVTHASCTGDVKNLIVAQRQPPPGFVGGSETRPQLQTETRPQLVAVRTSPWQPVWQETRVTLAGEGDYEFDKGRVKLANLDVSGDAVRFAVTGEIDQLATRCRVNLAGKLAYDLAGVAEKLRPMLGADVQIVGRDTRQFSLQGPLWTEQPATTLAVANAATSPARAAPLVPNELMGQASASWTSASFYGLTVGDSVLQTKLSEGVVNVAPLDLAVSEGRLKLSPRILLNENPAVLVLDRGPLVEQVRLSPALCQHWLKYVAPFLADATEAEGKFSVNLAGAKVPIFNPAGGSVGGVLSVHSARVGPGPLGQQLLLVAQQLKAISQRRPPLATLDASNQNWLQLPPQDVNFHMVDGRVYHENLQLAVNDLTIRTRGSVGADQSLDMIAEMAIPDRWLGDDKMLAGLKGRVLQIPIRGTLSKPQLDNRALKDLPQQIVTGTAEKLIEDELLKGLDRVLGPRKK